MNEDRRTTIERFRESAWQKIEPWQKLIDTPYKAAGLVVILGGLIAYFLSDFIVPHWDIVSSLAYGAVCVVGSQLHFNYTLSNDIPKTRFQWILVLGGPVFFCRNGRYFDRQRHW